MIGVKIVGFFLTVQRAHLSKLYMQTPCGLTIRPWENWLAESEHEHKCVPKGVIERLKGACSMMTDRYDLIETIPIAA